MSEMSHIDNETLVAYLYDEVDAAARAGIERHLQACGTCGGELAALSDVRAVLKSWAPPVIDLGFTVVQRHGGQPPATVLRPVQWWNTVPVWAQAAAAILVLAVAVGVANVQVRSGADGFVVTTGWMAPANAAVPVAPVTAGLAAEGENWKAALVSLEKQLREEIRSGRGGSDTVRAASRSGADEATVRRVQELLQASEDRQQRELALRLTQFNRDVNIQRQADLVKIQQLFGQSEGEIDRQRRMLNYVIRASGTPQQ